MKQISQSDLPSADSELTVRLGEIRGRMAEAAAYSGRGAEEITLMAVTKTVPPELVNLAFQRGVRLFGENRVQEYLGKCEQYVFDFNGIHFIGHLQTNKVKYIINKVCMIESVGSVRLCEEIEARAAAAGIKMSVLLEVNISSEATKSGFSESEIPSMLAGASAFPHLSVQGLFCIPEQGRGEYYFQKMHALFEDCRARDSEIHTLSMGMSEDYEAAIRNGSTLVRIGSALFGERHYTAGGQE